MVSNLGTLDLNSFPNLWLTHPLVTICILLKVLTVALVKTPLGVHLLCWGHTHPSLSSFTTALLESFAPTITLDVVSWLILTFLYFSQVRKPILYKFTHPRVSLIVGGALSKCHPHRHALNHPLTSGQSPSCTPGLQHFHVGTSNSEFNSWLCSTPTSINHSWWQMSRSVPNAKSHLVAHV